MVVQPTEFLDFLGIEFDTVTEEFADEETLVVDDPALFDDE